MEFLKKFKKAIILCCSILITAPFAYNTIYSNSFEFSETENTNIQKSIPETEKITLNCIFPLGEACRPSYHLQKNGLRFQAAPLDWMMKYSLKTALNLFETRFSNFFVNIKDVPNKFVNNCRVVNDVQNNVQCVHHFDKKVSLKEGQQKFRETMLRRAKKVDNIFKNSQSIGFICNRPKESCESLLNFACGFEKIYPGKQITLINVIDKNVEDISKQIIYEKENIKIIQYTFCDVPLEPDNQKHPTWKGDPQKWKKILSDINLVKTA